MTDFRAEGEKLHAEQPELMLAQVWWHAHHHSTIQADLVAFVEGYQAARARRDAFLAEQKEASTEPDPFYSKAGGAWINRNDQDAI